jgi:HlyD family secretion protein
VPSALRRSILAVLLLAAAGAAVWWATRPEPVRVSLETVARGRVEASISNTRAGEIEACKRAKLSTIQGGRIDYLGIEEGDQVHAGQVLLRLWNEDQQAQLALTRSQLETTKRRVGEACSAAENARRDAARQAELRAKGFVAPAREEQARFEADARQAACSAAQADVAAAQARVAAAEVDQRRSTLVAPFAGTVAKITGELGEYSTPSPPGVATPPAIDLIDASCLYVKAPMDEVDGPRIRAGQPVRVSIDAIPGRHFAGHVRRVAPYVLALEKQARTVDVEVDFDTPAEAAGLLVGYSTDVEIVLDTRESVLRIPTSAIRSGNTVLLLGADGVLEERAIQTGLANWEYSEVRSGLAEGDRVVTSLARDGVVPGARVEAEAAAAR